MSSYRVHVGDADARRLEEQIRSQFAETGVGVTVLRAGNVIDPQADAPDTLARLAPWAPLVASSLTSVFVTRDELFSAIDAATDNSLAGRTLTVLGANRRLRDILAEYPVRPVSRCMQAIAWLLSWLLVGRLIAACLSLASRLHEPLRRWFLKTLEPTSVSELLSLYHPLNQEHVALAGYNTGVVHFGWKYPQKTVVRTTSTWQLVRVHDDFVEVDAGVLLKRVIGELRGRRKELFVVPNYSYISMGTIFMVPVHGSGSEVSTLSDTIEQALIYDPQDDRLQLIKRGDRDFGRYMYNPQSGILVLRLRLRIRDRSQYFVKRTVLESASAADIWQTFTDPEASNIELRKSKAADSSVEVSKYYTTPSDAQDTMEVPRDSIGRLWDRLEENPVSSYLFHAFVRKCGFHVELFLNEAEFDIFWRDHSQLPLSKIQLRLVRSDGLSNSPFGDGDRISADIFMKRKDSPAFLSFMQEHLPNARFNPGKHSM
ncbi:MAG: hypothetical protein ACYTGL_17910 [Planctomycetota bacterium]